MSSTIVVGKPGFQHGKIETEPLPLTLHKTHLKMDQGSQQKT